MQQIENNILSLDEIGIKFNTDKSSKCHGFLEFYDKELTPLRNKKIKLLEIGIFKGASLKTWREYFTTGEIYGADISKDYINQSKNIPGVHVSYLDQSKKQELVNFFEKNGPFDIIIDDGSHIISHQKITLEVGLKYLNPKGVFILEDLHTSLPNQGKNYIDESLTALETVINLQDWSAHLLVKNTIGYKGYKSITSIIKNIENEK